MSTAYNPVEIKATQGGDLITNFSNENVGINNWVVKRDWRRVFDGESRREGDQLFYPNTDKPLGFQPYPTTTEPITLIHSARRGNSDTAVIVGTPTSLYRYFSMEDGAIYMETGPDTPVYDPDVFEDSDGDWIKIADGFSPSGHRWEAVDIGGITVFNNGVDLPYSYSLNEFVAYPLFELREQGIAAVGTIEGYNGVLMLADVSELTVAALEDTMIGRDSGSITATQSGFVVNTSAGFFLSTDVGKSILYDNGQLVRIEEFYNASSVRVNINTPVTGLQFRVFTAYGRITDGNLFDRTQYKIIWSELGDPSNFGLLVTGSATAGSTVITLDAPTFAIEPGDALVINGAGPSGTALSANVLFVAYDKLSLTLDVAANTTIADTEIFRSAGVSSIVGSAELQDDSSAILRMMELQGRLVIMKDTSIFVARFTGSADQPFEFSKVYAGPKTIFWRWMMAKVNGRYILFAGRNKFYSFDLGSNTPEEHEKLSLCDSIFFQTVTNPGEMENCYSAVNAITNEVWFVFPSPGDDKALCYDYLFNSCSTLGAVYTAAATVKKPVSGVDSGPSQDWFVLGLSTGTLLQYGLTNLGGALWSRNGLLYTSTMKSGYGNFGTDFLEKNVRSYVLLLGAPVSSPPSIAVTLYQSRNGHEAVTAVTRSRTITSPGIRNLMSVWMRNNYFQDQIVISGSSLNAKIAGRIYEIAAEDARSVTRRPV